MTPAQPARPGRAHPDLAGRAQGAHTPHAAVHRGPGWWARTVTSPALRAALGVTAAVCALGAVILARTEHAVAWHATGTFIGAVGGLILGTLIVDAAAPLLTSRAQRAGVRVLRSRWWFGLLLALVARSLWPKARKWILPLCVVFFVIDLGFVIANGAKLLQVDGNFDDYVSIGIGKTPMAFLYEFKIVRHALQKKGVGADMVLMYPQPTIVNKEVFVSLNERAKDLARELREQDHWDPQRESEHLEAAADLGHLLLAVAPLLADDLDELQVVHHEEREARASLLSPREGDDPAQGLLGLLHDGQRHGSDAHQRVLHQPDLASVERTTTEQSVQVHARVERRQSPRERE